MRSTKKKCPKCCPCSAWGKVVYYGKRAYEEAAKRLGVALSECIFVGDGGSNELVGAKNVGMKAIQAKWYTNQHPKKRDNISGFLVAEEPLDIIKYIE